MSIGRLIAVEVRRFENVRLKRTQKQALKYFRKEI